jgi:hypothetical protein
MQQLWSHTAKCIQMGFCGVKVIRLVNLEHAEHRDLQAAAALVLLQ